MKFRDEYFFLSNFYPCMLRCEGEVFQCAEAMFQAHKFITRPYIQHRFNNLSGAQARKLGRETPMNQEEKEFWEKNKRDIMYAILELKFVPGSELAKKLIATGDIELVEDNDWGDTYWGRCNGIGKNMLGKCLMEIRTILQERKKDNA